MKEDQEDAVVACSLEGADLADRRERWLQLGERAGIDVLTTKNGLRLLFRAAPGVEGELGRLAELERDCCAFAEWSVHTRGEELALDVTADSEERHRGRAGDVQQTPLVTRSERLASSAHGQACAHTLDQSHRLYPSI
jgi:hypothetical protein